MSASVYYLQVVWSAEWLCTSTKPYLEERILSINPYVHSIAHFIHHILLFAMLISSYCDDQYCHKMIISTQQGPY